jgi:hypothetical protein
MGTEYFCNLRYESRSGLVSKKCRYTWHLAKTRESVAKSPGAVNEKKQAWIEEKLTETSCR